jgi:hypothetical protein
MIAGALPWRFNLCHVLRLIPIAWQNSETVSTFKFWHVMFGALLLL